MTTATVAVREQVPAGADTNRMCDQQAERIVLGAMMLSPAAVDATADILVSGDFYWPHHGMIWETIRALWAAGEPSDPQAVAWALAESDPARLARSGGAPYLHTLVESVPVAANATYYARQVQEWSRRRRIREAGIRVAQAAGQLHTDVDTVTEQAQREIHDATVTRRTSMVTVADIADSELAHLESVAAGEIEPGIPSGIVDLDRLLGGWHPGRLIIPAGRPAMGKSLFSLGCALKAAILGFPVLIFPMEMSRREVMWRLLSNYARVPLHRFQDASFYDEDWVKLRRAYPEVAKLPITIDDRANTGAQIAANTRKHAQKHPGPGLVIVDYIQRMTLPGRDKPNVEIGLEAKALKTLAVEVEKTVFGVCQFNRGPTDRADKRPQLSDLRGSGELEQEADQVIGIHREDYYDKESPRAGEGDLIVLKNRHGADDTVTVAAQLHFARFVDMAIV